MEDSVLERSGLRRNMSGRWKRMSAYAMNALNRKASSTGDLQTPKEVKGISIKTYSDTPVAMPKKEPGRPSDVSSSSGKKRKKREGRKRRSSGNQNLRESRNGPKKATFKYSAPDHVEKGLKVMEILDVEGQRSQKENTSRKVSKEGKKQQKKPQQKISINGTDKDDEKESRQTMPKRRKVETGDGMEDGAAESAEGGNSDDEAPPLIPGNAQMMNGLVNANEFSPLWLMYDSEDAAQSLLSWMIYPLTPDDFYKNVWEKKPVLLKRDCSTYYGDMFSSKELDEILRNKAVDFGASIDVTEYVDQVRKTYNPPGRAHADLVWNMYNRGCSIRMRDPQAHSEKVWKICQVLQESFSSFAGANVYLTPPGTQGFAPHWDDIDAFVLQLEGSKYWRVYEPRTEEERLPRESSENFNDGDLPNPPITEGRLEPGDLLYIPRGFIHQGHTHDEGEADHSLHITISVCQKNSWMDFVGEVVPAVLEVVGMEHAEYRQSLPRDFLSTMGVANELKGKAGRRKEFKKKLRGLLDKVVDTAMGMVDESVDQYAKNFFHGALPPILTETDKSCSSRSNGWRWEEGQDAAVMDGGLNLNSRVKLLRKHICRLVDDDDAREGYVRIFHCADNSRNYKEKDPQYFDVPSEARPCVYALMQTYPDYVELRDVAAEDKEVNNHIRMEVCQELFRRGILIKEMDDS